MGRGEPKRPSEPLAMLELTPGRPATRAVGGLVTTTEASLGRCGGGPYGRREAEPPAHAASKKSISSRIARRYTPRIRAVSPV